MLDDMMNITVDQVFTPNTCQISKDNGFELLYNHTQGFNLRNPIDHNLYPVPELAQKRNFKIMPKSVIKPKKKIDESYAHMTIQLLQKREQVQSLNNSHVNN